MTNLRPTIRDVAKLAGVSHQTVSRVINQNGNVNPETRIKVESAISELNFIPSVIARSMAWGKTHTLACISPSIIDFTYASIIEAAQSQARKSGYFMISVPASDQELFSKSVNELILSKRTDGLLVINPCPEDWQNSIPVDFPKVIVGGSETMDMVSTVGLDEVSAGKDATQHLIDLGHKRIALITGPLEEYTSRERLAGYRNALEEANLQLDESLILNGDWSATAGYECVTRLLRNKVDFSAVFSQNDRMAIGVIKGLNDHHINVPEDVSVIGFDDMPLSSYYTPPLTTMEQNMAEIGIQSAKLLMRAIEKRQSPVKHIHLPSRIIVRSSTSLFRERR